MKFLSRPSCHVYMPLISFVKIKENLGIHNMAMKHLSNTIRARENDKFLHCKSRKATSTTFFETTVSDHITSPSSWPDQTLLEQTLLETVQI